MCISGVCAELLTAGLLSHPEFTQTGSVRSWWQKDLLHNLCAVRRCKGDVVSLPFIAAVLQIVVEGRPHPLAELQTKTVNLTRVKRMERPGDLKTLMGCLAHTSIENCELVLQHLNLLLLQVPENCQLILATSNWSDMVWPYVVLDTGVPNGRKRKDARSAIVDSKANVQRLSMIPHMLSLL